MDIEPCTFDVRSLPIDSNLNINSRCLPIVSVDSRCAGRGNKSVLLIVLIEKNFGLSGAFLATIF